MKHLFSNTGQQALQQVLRLRPLMAFDFDGTLAPIVARPDDARVSSAISHRLRHIAEHLPVAIVTGRRVADVADRLGFEPQFIVGSHGAEDPQAETAQALIEALGGLRARLAARTAQTQAAGVFVEDKAYSIALHFRLARDRAAAESLIEDLLRDLEPDLRAFGGKCVVNVVPRQAPDKGDAVVSLVARTGSQAAVFVGDDLNDEPVFERAPPHWLTVRIGRDDPHSRAEYFLDSHAEMATLLQEVVEFLNAGATAR